MEKIESKIKQVGLMSKEADEEKNFSNDRISNGLSLRKRKINAFLSKQRGFDRFKNEGQKEYQITKEKLEIPNEINWYFCYPFSEEEEEILDTLLNGATVRNQRINAVRTIVYQELGGYFADQKTLDQTIDVIQNRVQLYLNEQ